MKPKNIKEFQALVERYESITLEEIEKAQVNSRWSYGISERTANILTGYHNTSTCTLCLATKTKEVDYDCQECIYISSEGCHWYNNHDSYMAIMHSTTPNELLSAFRARAKYLRKTYPQYLTK